MSYFVPTKFRFLLQMGTFFVGNRIGTILSLISIRNQKKPRHRIDDGAVVHS
ncbi:hypothetical protein CLV98_104331 [Dyadobacter jejuensis]|uniref:Uncharacterized protein n=1 Tax=Dyadobacter jejuensis TaxID=1082580 RepID=A0A316ALN3_9BACT|nr:hypothetical protein CLV98_104331 [Dyadobacter jejuensis]